MQTASALFYERGVRAVGVDLLVEKAGVAKTSLYRHFHTKDDLIAAYLEREDADFWRLWDEASAAHPDDPRAELDAHFQWIGERVRAPHYRGCPQINVAVEFPEAGHPARIIASAHKKEMKRRLVDLARRMGVARAEELATQLAVLVNGAFVSPQTLAGIDASLLLQRAGQALVAAAG